MPTIREILATENPELKLRWKGTTYNNTQSKTDSYDSVIFNDIQNSTVKKWNDFTYDAIELAYGDILGIHLEGYKKPNTPTNSPRTIEVEDNLDSFLEGCLGSVVYCKTAPRRSSVPVEPPDYVLICLHHLFEKARVLTESGNLDVLRESLKKAAMELRKRSKESAPQDINPTLANERITWKNPKVPNVGLTPDWVVCEQKVFKEYPEERSAGNEQKLAYIVGDSKLTEKWKSEYLKITEKDAKKVDAPCSWANVKNSDDEKPEPLNANGRKNVTKERILPLQQLATYCRFAATRYFFLVTQEEVVVFRVRRIDGKKLVRGLGAGQTTRKYAAFEYRSIPWRASGTTRLNFNLAVWALACMGMNDKHREMEGPKNTPLDEMVRLTHWVKDTAKGEYTNEISGRVIREEDWAKLKTDFVELTPEKGYSKTSDFYSRSLETALPDRPKTRAHFRASQQQTSTSAGTSRPRNTATTPAPLAPQTLPLGKPRTDRSGAPPSSGTSRQQARGSTSRGTAAASATKAVTAMFKDRRLPVIMEDELPVSISIGPNDVRPITRSIKGGRIFYVKDEGKKVAITLKGL